MKKVEFQEGITKVDGYCFLYCVKLSKVILPSTITELGYIFPQCYSLKDVYVKAMIPPVLSSDVFGSVNLNQLSIWVPRESVEAYKEKWSTYKDNIKGYDF